jgi:hypothetical protein
MRGRCSGNAPRLRVAVRGSRAFSSPRSPRSSRAMLRCLRGRVGAGRPAAIEPLAPRAEAVVGRLAKKMMHMLVEALQPVALSRKLRLLGPLRVALPDRSFAFGDRGIALGDDLRGQRAQALKILRKRLGHRAQTRIRAHSRENAMHFLGDDSIDRRSLHGLRRRHSARMDAAPIEAFERRPTGISLLVSLTNHPLR